MSVVIYGKPNCGDCAKAELLCVMQGLKYLKKTLDVDYSLEDLESFVGGSVRSVPQIFMGGHYIGGYDDFRKHVYSLHLAS